MKEDVTKLYEEYSEEFLFCKYLTETIEKNKAAVQKALDETQLLFDSLMQKYFG